MLQTNYHIKLYRNPNCLVLQLICLFMTILQVENNVRSVHITELVNITSVGNSIFLPPRPTQHDSNDIHVHVLPRTSDQAYHNTKATINSRYMTPPTNLCMLVTECLSSVYNDFILLSYIRVHLHS